MKRAALVAPAGLAAKNGPGAEVPSWRRRARVFSGVGAWGTRRGGSGEGDVPTFLGMWERGEELRGKGEMLKGEAVGEGESPRRRRVCTVLGSWRGLVTRMVILPMGEG
jgi:hypothetical protein